MNNKLKIHAMLYEIDEGIEYNLDFSEEDAKAIISAQVDTIELPSIRGKISVNENTASILYGNGQGQLGSIYTNYNDLCKQLLSSLESKG